MFCMLKNTYPAYVSNHNSNSNLEKQVILLMILKKLSTLRGITSKNNDDFFV